MTYAVTINATCMQSRLSEIEQGNPVRHYECTTLRAAIQIANTFRFGAGHAMKQGPRTIPAGRVAYMSTTNDPFHIEIQRLK